SRVAAEPRPDKERSTAARRAFEDGKKAYNIGDFDRAIELWKQAYEYRDDPIFLYNIAQAYRQKGDAQKAIFFYRAYTRESPRAPGGAKPRRGRGALRRPQEHPLGPPPARPAQPGPRAPPASAAAPAASGTGRRRRARRGAAARRGSGPAAHRRRLDHRRRRRGPARDRHRLRAEGALDLRRSRGAEQGGRALDPGASRPRVRRRARLDDRHRRHHRRRHRHRDGRDAGVAGHAILAPGPRRADLDPRPFRREGRDVVLDFRGVRYRPTTPMTP